jgi:hypothetical protein
MLHHILINQKHIYVNSKLMINAEFTNKISSISAFHQEHTRLININESKEINKVTNQRNKINILSINHEMTINNLINHVC